VSVGHPIVPAVAERIARRLDVLGQEVRVRLVYGLHDHGELSVGELAELVGVSVYDASQHLSVLRSEGIVRRTRDRQYVRYRRAFARRTARSTRGSRPPVRRYQCSSRRHGGDCSQPIVKAEPLEAQLIDWLYDFQPTPEMRKRILAQITLHTHQDDDQARRKELMGQADRLKDLYMLGDLTKAQYIMRRQAIQDELERLEPTIDPDVAEAEQLLSNFAEFWEVESASAERRRLLLSLFEQVWEDGGRIVAVKPRCRLASYFQATAETHESRSGFVGVQNGSDGTRTRDLRRDRPAL
jgi:DNA-binding transcriptional ArsR family regulator